MCHKTNNSNEWKEREERKTVLLIIMKKYPTMLESLNFVSQKPNDLNELKEKKRNCSFYQNKKY